MEHTTQFGIIVFLTFAHGIVTRLISLVVGNDLMILSVVVRSEIQLDGVFVIDAIQTAPLEAPRLIVQVVVEAPIGIFRLHRTISKFPVIVAADIERQLVVGFESELLAHRI